jgi:hypothetical protein
MPEGSFPKPYVNTVPREGSDGMMEYVPFDKMGIGARASGLPTGGTNNVKSIEHVGKTAGGKK